MTRRSRLLLYLLPIRGSGQAGGGRARGDVRHVSAQIRRQRVDRVLCVLLEVLCRIEVIACHSASKPGSATNTEPRLYSSVLLSVSSCRPDEQAEDGHSGHEHQQYKNDRGRNAHTDILAAATNRGQRDSRSMYGSRRVCDALFEL
jgi:hypothetical protein